MNRNDAKNLLIALHAKGIETAGVWVRSQCPLAPWTHDHGKDSNPSFAIKTFEDGRRSFFNCFACNTAGPLEKLLMELLHLNQPGPEERPMDLGAAYKLLDAEGNSMAPIPDWSSKRKVEDDFTPWPEYWLDSFTPANNWAMAVGYMAGRGFTEQDLIDWDVRYDHQRNAVAFPFRQRDTNILAGMRGRYIIPIEREDQGPLKWHDYGFHDMRNGKTTYYNEHRVDFLRPVVVVEGAIKAMAVGKIYPNVLSPLSTGASGDKIRRLATAVEVITGFDNDTGGERAHDKFVKYLGNRVTGKLVYPDEHADKDVDQIPPEALAQMLADAGAKPYTLTSPSL